MVVIKLSALAETFVGQSAEQFGGCYVSKVTNTS